MKLIQTILLILLGYILSRAKYAWDNFDQDMKDPHAWNATIYTIDKDGNKTFGAMPVVICHSVRSDDNCYVLEVKK